MATIIPFGQKTVGNGTVTLISFFTSNEFPDTTYPFCIHKMFVQAAIGNTNQIDVKYAGKIICSLQAAAAGSEPGEHYLTGDENVGNEIDISQITFTGTNSGDKVNGYLTAT